MRGRARMRPDRRPQHERDAGAAGARVGGGQRDAAGQAGDDGAEAARRGEPQHAALGRSQHRERQLAVARAAAVAHVAADQREDDVLALVQRGERADAERRRVVGDEQDGLAHLGSKLSRPSSEIERRSQAGRRSALLPRLRPSARAV